MRASKEHVIHFQSFKRAYALSGIILLRQRLTHGDKSSKGKEEASEMCLLNATINLIGR
jgi:hypothetical protein